MIRNAIRLRAGAMSLSALMDLERVKGIESAQPTFLISRKTPENRIFTEHN
jgi:hypothetical protein